MIVYLLLVVSVAVNLYLVFYNTMNRIQYLEFLRLYWITRDTGLPNGPRVERSVMLQTSPPFWQGKGVTFRFGKYTFQVGILLRKGSSILDQLGGRELEEDAKDIREWA